MRRGWFAIFICKGNKNRKQLNGYEEEKKMAALFGAAFVALRIYGTAAFGKTRGKLGEVSDIVFVWIDGGGAVENRKLWAHHYNSKE